VFAELCRRPIAKVHLLSQPTPEKWYRVDGIVVVNGALQQQHSWYCGNNNPLLTNLVFVVR
jgi:hypothetical protein